MIALARYMVRTQGRETVRVTKVKGRAEDVGVQQGRVRLADQQGNAEADAAADLGRRHQSEALIDARRRLLKARSHWYPIMTDLPAPVVESVAPALVVQAPALVVEYIAPAPAVLQAPTPVHCTRACSCPSAIASGEKSCSRAGLVRSASARWVFVTCASCVSCWRSSRLCPRTEFHLSSST